MMTNFKGGFSLAVIVLIALLFNYGAPQQNKLRSTQKRPKMKSRACPTTCTLKRRIAKAELLFKKKLAILDEKCSTNDTGMLHASAISLSASNSVAAGDFLNQISRNFTEVLQADVDRTLGELKNTLVEGQATIQSTVDQVNALILTLPTTGESSSQTYLNENVEESSRALNESILSLKQQTDVLANKTEETDMAVRRLSDENALLTAQNRKSRARSQRLDEKITALQARITSLESAVTAIEEAERSRDRTPPVLQSELPAVAQQDINQAKVAVSEAIDRINRLEQWVESAGAAGSNLPPLIPPTTSHPQPDTPANDCLELHQMGYQVSGVYTIRPWQSRESFQVYCEQTYYGGGWTMIQRRRDGSESFDRDWDDYAMGFGDLKSEFWLGNEKIHALTNQNTYRLHIVMQDWEEQRTYAEYEGFKMSSFRDYYSIRFGAYRGTAGDGLRGTAEDGSRNLYLSRFSTRDLDNDSCSPCMYQGRAFSNCARLQKSGWWYRACSDSNLNGPYITKANFTSCGGRLCRGIQWRTWHDEVNYSLRASVMLIKLAGTLDEAK